MRDLFVRVAQLVGVYKQMMCLDNKIQMYLQNKAFKRYGLDALKIIEEAADEAGAHLFLAFGTLLGAYREHGFIAHDCDLDTGLLAEERTDALTDSLKSNGFTLLRQYYVKSTGRICEDKWVYKGVHVDIHYFYKDIHGDLFCDLCMQHENKPWREANVTDGFPAVVRTLPFSKFEKKSFMGLQVYMPERTEEWLKTLYGEQFMTPDPNWSMLNHKKRATYSEERLYRR